MKLKSIKISNKSYKENVKSNTYHVVKMCMYRKKQLPRFLGKTTINIINCKKFNVNIFY